MRERTRKQRKARWIKIKNDYWKYPECVIGDAYCDHVYDETNPWQWVDFRFLSRQHSRRYFAVAAQTLRFAAYHQAQELADDAADKDWPLPDNGCYFGPAEMDGTWGKVYELLTTEEYDEQYKRWSTANQEYLKHFMAQPVLLRPQIEVRLEYGPVAVGVWALLNKPRLDPAGLSEFVQQFRDLGEPLKQGIVWQGEEVQVVPAEINEGA